MHKFLPLCLSLLLLMGCTPEKEVQTSINDVILPDVLDYDIAKDDFIKWVDVFNQKDKRYIVYFYSPYCGYCRTVKEDILSYYLLKLEPFYLVDAIAENAVFKSNDGKIIGTNKLEDLYILGTPFLLEITNYRVTNYYAGVESIRLYISTRKDI